MKSSAQPDPAGDPPQPDRPAAPDPTLRPGPQTALARPWRPSRSESMREDCRLADGLRLPPAWEVRSARVALLTGATGFAGRYVARELLASTSLSLVCLVRADDASRARQRLLAALHRIGVAQADLDARIEVVCGNVSEPDLGLAPADRIRLAETVDRVYHCAAEVNWAHSYRQLRRTNVLGVLEVLRFAFAARPKPVVFLSTIAVCYAQRGPAAVDELTDMSPWLDRMPLGYAQSKTVAEALLRAAAASGLPVSILRPALISGDTVTGESNLGDLIAALVEGTATMGAAVDTDWLVDCVPVDFVARVIAHLPEPDVPGLRVLHLAHDRPRHWRELVLWMKLAGCQVELLTVSDWLARAFDQRGVAGTRLYGYRRFFQGATGMARPFETYLEPGQRRISCDRTRELLARIGTPIPPLDSSLLHRYFDCYEHAGLLSLSRRSSGARRGDDGRTGVRPADGAPAGDGSAGAPGLQALQTILRERWRRDDLELLDARPLPFVPVNGILNEIASARLGPAVGIRRYALHVRRAGMRGALRLATLVKSKPSDDAMQDAALELAALADPALGETFAAFRDDLAIVGAHERELAVYGLRDPRLRRCAPRCYGRARDAASGLWILALEFVEAIDPRELGPGAGEWDRVRVEAAIRGIAGVHAIHHGRDDALRDSGWLGAVNDSARAVRLAPLWEALQRFAAPRFAGWAGPDLVELHAGFVERIDSWFPRHDALPSTLVHNDFNPRNVALRDTGSGLRLCAFDWELAAIGLPQHDLAELLCFVAPDDLDRDGLDALLELHRCTLQASGGLPIGRDAQREGFGLSLRRLLVERLPMYALIDRFRPQTYLPRVMRNWMRLRALASRWS